MRLSANGATRPLITFLMLHGHLQPGYDYLLERKFSSLWRELRRRPRSEPTWTGSPPPQASWGSASRVELAVASQVPARLLIQTGRRLDQLTMADLEEFAAACRERQQRTGKSWWHYKAALSNTHRVLFHLQILPEPPGAGAAGQLRRPAGRDHPADRRRAGGLPGPQARDLHAKTVSSLATRLDALRPVPHPGRPRPCTRSPTWTAAATSSRT